MKFILNKDKLEIENIELVKSGSISYYEADVEYDDSWKDLVIEAVMVKRGEDEGTSIAVINNKMYIDQNFRGTYQIGFVGYTIENDIKTYQVSTNLKSIYFDKGAGEIETENEELPTPTEWEKYIAQIQEMLKNCGNGGEGTTDYNALENKPQINGVELTGNKTAKEFNIPTFENLGDYVMLKYSERIGHFVSTSGVNYEIDTDNKTITINDGFLFYLTSRNTINKRTLNINQDSVFSYLVYDLKATTESGKILSITQPSFDATRHVIICILRRDYYTIPSANWIEGRYKVNGFLYNPETELRGAVYVSTSGSDKAIGDRNHPFRTINKAIESGARTIYVLAGTYKEAISKSVTGGEIEIIAKPLSTTNKDVIIDLGYELSMVADNTTGLVKGAYTSTSNDWIYKVFVTKEKPIQYIENNSENKEVSRGYTCNLWNGDTRLTPVLSLEECKATSNTWFYDGTNVYANAGAGTFVLDNGMNQYGINLSYYKKVKLNGITVKYASEIGTWLKGCSDSEINRCTFLNTGVYHGLKLESTSSVVRNCNAGYNGKDGLNIHGVCTADFIDCISHDNLDDGISHHIESGGMVIGGEYYNNIKGGVCSPTFGSRNGVNGVYTHNNGNGIYAVTDTDKEYPPCTISNCMIKENTIGIRANRYTFNCWNNILLDNETDTSEENGGVINIYNNKKYELIKRIEITEENVSTITFNISLDKLYLFCTIPQASVDCSAGLELHKGSELIGYTWLANLMLTTSARVCQIMAKNENGISHFENTAPQNYAGIDGRVESNLQNVNRRARYVEGNTPFTRIYMYTSGSKPLPVGSIFELWGVKA